MIATCKLWMNLFLDSINEHLVVLLIIIEDDLKKIETESNEISYIVLITMLGWWYTNNHCK